MHLNFTRRQKIILTIYFIIGLPMLPMVPWILVCPWMCGDKQIYQRENREQLILQTLSMQVAGSLFAGLVALLIHFLH